MHNWLETYETDVLKYTHVAIDEVRLMQSTVWNSYFLQVFARNNDNYSIDNGSFHSTPSFFND